MPEENNDIFEIPALLVRPESPMMTTAKLRKLKPILNLAGFARLAGLPTVNLHKKVERGTPLTEDEARALDSVLFGFGTEVH